MAKEHFHSAFAGPLNHRQFPVDVSRATEFSAPEAITSTCSVPVMVATGGDSNLLADHLVDQPVLVGDPSRPIAGQSVL